MIKYEPLKIDYEIPEELQIEIDHYIDNLNNDNGSSEDCYRMEIMCILNWCYRERILTNEQIDELREYYQHKGILKHGREC
ncbi:MAG: hypothetical protein IJT77_08185 [Clostridia bacterium]|nr:hypothetical protein [Clostridia bacterium]